MRRPRVTTAVLLAVLALTATGCARPADDPRAAGVPGPPSSPPGDTRGGEGYCPPPEAPAGTGPSPCITFDWNQRVAENHAYREEMPITDAQRAQARPKADALAAALGKLKGARVSEARVRTVAGGALRLPPRDIEVRTLDGDPPSWQISMGGGWGKVCVNGSIDGTGKASAVVAGRTKDGTCLPGEGGH